LWVFPKAFNFFANTQLQRWPAFLRQSLRDSKSASSKTFWQSHRFPLRWIITIINPINRIRNRVATQMDWRFSLTKNKFPDLFLPNVYTYASDNFTFYKVHNISTIVFSRKKEQYLPAFLKNNVTIIIVPAISPKVSTTIIYTADFDSNSLLKHPINPQG